MFAFGQDIAPSLTAEGLSREPGHEIFSKNSSFAPRALRAIWGYRWCLKAASTVKGFWLENNSNTRLWYEIALGVYGIGPICRDTVPCMMGAIHKAVSFGTSILASLLCQR